MALNFPNVADVHLRRAPLQEVICQVRFPPLLRITHEEPVDFQEQVRERFPLFKVEKRVVFAEEGIKQASVPSSKIYRFHNSDETVKISLGADFYALSTTAYQSWKSFAELLAYTDAAVQAEYEIPYATRIGLRYINELDMSLTHSHTLEEMLSLLRVELTAILKTEVLQIPQQALHYIKTMVDGDHFSFRYGLTQPPEGQQQKFLLDFDYYTEGRLSLEDLLERCDSYHKTIYYAFRWCIAEGKLAHFQPAEK